MAKGIAIETRHRAGCPKLTGGRCNCKPAFRAVVWNPVEKRKLTRTFRNRDEAAAWERDVREAMGRDEAPDPRKTVAEAWAEFAADLDAGRVLTRKKRPYALSARRSYLESWKLRIGPVLGHLPMADVSRRRWQLLIDDLTAAGASASTIRNTVTAGRALWRHAIRRGTVPTAPFAELEVPLAGPGRDRIVTPEEAAELIAPLPVDLQALYGLAYFAGLRRGEILALDVEDVRDPATGEVRDSVRVTKSWDATARKPVAPKSKAGTREVDLVSALRATLAAYLLSDGRREGPLFGSPERRLDPRGIARRAATAWKLENEERAEAGQDLLVPVGLHELRHGYGSALIAGGVSATDAAEAMGHADGGALLLARYSHPMPDARRATARKLEAFLASRAG